MEPHSDSVVTYRGAVVENTHRIHAAITDATGALLFSVGNPLRVTLARSAAKPAQILTLLEIEGFDEFGFDDADIALMCSSHSSEDVHISRGRSMLQKVPAEERDLCCGGHDSLSDEVSRSWIKQNFTPGALCNNCSAKHIGTYAAASLLNKDTANDYHLPSHEVQVRVAQTMAELSGLKPDEIIWAIDGCNLPAPALPLRDLSYIYAQLANARDNARRNTLCDSRTKNLARIFDAMWKNPDMVAGKGRFCTELMLTFDGALVGKLGADGCYGVAIRETEKTRLLGAKGALGIAVKVEDGSTEILYAAVMEILRQLDVAGSQHCEALHTFYSPARSNTAGQRTGKVVFDVKLR